MVEMWGRFSTQLLNSKPLVGLAMYFVPLVINRYIFVGYSLLLHEIPPG
jgi:hypothetical protein